MAREVRNESFHEKPYKPTIVIRCMLIWLSRGYLHVTPLPVACGLTREQVPRSQGGVGRDAPPRRPRDVLDQPGRGRPRRDREALPGGILTGQTALYAHGLVTAPPDRIDLATKRGGTKIRDAAVRQHFIPEGWLGVGRSTVSVDGTELAAYDPERMLLELMRSRNKLPYDLYREAVASFRRRSERLDIYRLQDYAEAIPHGEAHLERAMEEVF